jgi:hypothetical protein
MDGIRRYGRIESYVDTYVKREINDHLRQKRYFIDTPVTVPDHVKDCVYDLFLEQHDSNINDLMASIQPYSSSTIPYCRRGGYRGNEVYYMTGTRTLFEFDRLIRQIICDYVEERRAREFVTQFDEHFQMVSDEEDDNGKEIQS